MYFNVKRIKTSTNYHDTQLKQIKFRFSQLPLAIVFVYKNFLPKKLKNNLIDK